MGCSPCLCLYGYHFGGSHQNDNGGTAILLQYTAPIYVALFSAWFLQERTTREDWLTVLVVMVGIVLFVLDSLTPGKALGNICGILSGISFGAMALFLRKQKDGSPL
ncbi:MAG: EamA family transporter [Firmicutes bacterium]|nr:EamA family transporter [Bacillota bacterium]